MTVGAAFPRQNDEQLYAELGMTLRDWFAGQTLVSFLNNPDAAASIQGLAAEEGRHPAGLAAEMAYYQADAMIAEREKTDD